jgi:DNA-binding protein YbaB
MFGNISQILEMKKKADEMKAKLNAVSISETTNGVTVQCNGTKKITSIHIADELMQDKNKLQVLLNEAINKALDKADQVSKEELAQLTSGLGPLAGLFK